MRGSPGNEETALAAVTAGLFRIAPGDATRGLVREALEVGVRSFDTAAAYRNEADVGDAIAGWCADRGTRREDVFVSSKIPIDHFGYDETRRAVDDCAARLGRPDLLLLHWPVADLRLDSWRALVAARDAGAVGTIGVSNFTVRHLRELIDTSGDPPSVNQVEMHPWLPQNELLEFSGAHGIVCQAYSPLGQGRLLRDPVVVDVADRAGLPPAELLLGWANGRGTPVVTRSRDPERLRRALGSAEVTLDPTVAARLDALACDRRTAWDPSDEP